MANPEHVALVRLGAAAVEVWRLQNPEVPLDLSGADLSSTRLTNINFERADLRGAGLDRSVLSNARLFGSNLRRASLRNAKIYGAILGLTNLEDADLSGADLGFTSFIRVRLQRARLLRANLVLARLVAVEFAGTDLSGAEMGVTSIEDCDLTLVEGLPTVAHSSPSDFNIGTLITTYRSAGGRLPDDLSRFFRAAGVPAAVLDALPRIAAADIYCTTLISYGSPDAAFATRLRDSLVREGVSCWLYELDATPGEPTWPEIFKEMQRRDKTIVVCSAAALLRNGVRKELDRLIDESRDKLVPISLDNLWTDPNFTVMWGDRDLKPFLMERNYADFAKLAYDEALQRLLKALRRPLAEPA